MPVAPHLAAAGDLKGDGKADVALTGHDSHGVHVFLGDGRGRLAAAPGSPFAALAAGKAHNHGLALGDVDLDGDLDMATTDDEAHCVPILLNDGRGRFAPAPASPFVADREPYPLALADLNGDGRLDVLTPNVGAGTISVLLGDGKGGFAAAAGRSPLDIGRRTWKAVLHDMNADAALDLVLGGGGAVVVLLGDGRGGFELASGAPFSVGREARTVTLGDFDGDGKTDVASADLGAHTVTILLQR